MGFWIVWFSLSSRRQATVGCLSLLIPRSKIKICEKNEKDLNLFHDWKKLTCGFFWLKDLHCFLCFCCLSKGRTYLDGQTNTNNKIK
jgi:hypothetical protein